MIETKDLILDKAKFSDWEEMYRNVWSQPECAKYMLWNITESEDDAKIRIQKTIDFQKSHDTYLVYEKTSAKAIGFAGTEKITSDIYEEAGICLGTDFIGKGYGKQVLSGLMDYVREKFGAKIFVYSARENNIASNKLALSFGFVQIASEDKTDERNGQKYKNLKYIKALS